MEHEMARLRRLVSSDVNILPILPRAAPEAPHGCAVTKYSPNTCESSGVALHLISCFLSIWFVVNRWIVALHTHTEHRVKCMYIWRFLNISSISHILLIRLTSVLSGRQHFPVNQSSAAFHVCMQFVLFLCVLVCVCMIDNFPGFQTDVKWQHLKSAADLGQWVTHVSCIHLHRVFLSSPFLTRFFFPWSIYLSQSLQAVALGWQTAHASFLLKKTDKSGSSLLFRTRLLKHGTTAATHCKSPLPYITQPPCDEPSIFLSSPNCFFFSLLEKPGCSQYSIGCLGELSPILFWPVRPSRSSIRNKKLLSDLHISRGHTQFISFSSHTFK